MFNHLTTRVNNRVRRSAIRMMPGRYMYTSEGYIIQFDMRNGTVRFVNPVTGAFLTEEEL